eukprot:jgi/Picsp_1/1400/NSC_04879-R1_transitional endoplasmic reticulum atpase
MAETEHQVATTTLGSWWTGIGKTSEPPQSVENGYNNPDSKNAAGGAKAQSRFSGQTAKPLFHSVALSSRGVHVEQTAVGGQSNNTSGVGRKGTNDGVDWSLLSADKRASSLGMADTMGSGRGHRCDGLTVEVAGVTGWEWSLDEWKWVRRSESNGHSLYENTETNKLQSEIAARRWGDGRDTLRHVVGRDESQQAQCDQVGKNKRTKVARGDAYARNSSHGGFQYVGGFEELKKSLMQAAVYPLKYRRLCDALGIAPGRGVLLTGPSGSGKTHMIHNLGIESGLFLEYISGSDCVGSKAAENRLKKAFEKAKGSAPSILFVDNIDAAAPSREKTSSNSVDMQATTMFMSLLDDLRRKKAQVAVICATSRPDAIDPALRRPGRLDVEMHMGVPSVADKHDILKVCTKNVPLDGDVDLELISSSLQGYLAADIAAVVTEAAMACVVETVHSFEEELHESYIMDIRPVLSKKNFETAQMEVQPSTIRNWSLHVPSATDTSWDDIGGLYEIKSELKELIQWPIHHQDILQKFNMPFSGGALLYGPPGCGKTLLAKAAAHSCDANFLCVNGPELLQMWMGESERNIREIFSAARLAAPCVIFFDEIDSLAPKRKNSGSKDSDMASRIVAQLLCEIDGLSKSRKEGIIVIGATNRPASVDPALLRPGRLGNKLLHVPLPDHRARKSIMKKSLNKCPTCMDFDLECYMDQHEELLSGFSGADVHHAAMNVCRLMIRDCIAAEESNVDNLEIALNENYMSQALSGTRRSVSEREERYFEQVKESMASGHIPEPNLPGSDSKIPISLAVNLAHQVWVSKSAPLQQRIEELERTLMEHGIDIPLGTDDV